ncbi:class I SAM-dependent methyltransferase [Candidatus Dojkabacteria bacterium]|nr:class I SAM-dependent methyltransferase [Candidatus Dojkabacteria bacterium]
MQWKDSEPTSLATELITNKIVVKGSHILDLGCGFGRNSNYLASQGAIVDAININSDELREAHMRAEQSGVKVNYINADAGKLPFNDSSFDVLLDAGCTHMCNREKQEDSAKEAARVVKKDGYLQYFGFNKEHPSYKKNPDNPQFRDLEDIKRQYGENFEIITVKTKKWTHENSENVGFEIMMKRK